jgi:hypothetical protein
MTTVDKFWYLRPSLDEVAFDEFVDAEMEALQRANSWKVSFLWLGVWSVADRGIERKHDEGFLALGEVLESSHLWEIVNL